MFLNLLDFNIIGQLGQITIFYLFIIHTHEETGLYLLLISSGLNIFTFNT